jgi:Zn-dependent peptidase ImmA (M78 family)
MLRRSGVSEYDVDAERPPEEKSVEVFCNAVAAAVIMPRDRFLTDELVQSREQGGWQDDQIEVVAQKFGASREAVVRRLYTFGRVSREFYEAKRAQYGREWQQHRARQKDEFKDKPFRKNPPQDALSDFGKPFIRLVLNTFYNDQITLSDVSSYLNVRVRHVPTIEQKMGLA